MKVKIIENIEDFPQFEAQNVFQTVEWMCLFEGEEDTRVVFFVVYGDRELLMVQPVVIHRFVKWLSWRLGAYAVVWREPWRAENIADEEAVEAFRLVIMEIEKYCRTRALYIEYRHFSQCSIYNEQCTREYKILPWYNIYREFDAGEDVAEKMKRDKRRQLKQSFESGVMVVLEPTKEQIVEWYGLLKRLYKRIHRPLPSVDVFFRLNKSGIGRVFVVTYRGRVISGSAMLYFVNEQQSLVNSFNHFCFAYSPKVGGQYRSMNKCQLFYDWYRASVDERIEGVYPSVVATWQALQLVADMGGGKFDFMGAGPRNREYGVRNFKLEFGGELTPEYRYKKFLV